MSMPKKTKKKLPHANDDQGGPLPSTINPIFAHQFIAKGPSLKL